MGNKITNILVVNAGSSSVKLAVWVLDEKPKKLAYGSIERLGQKEAELFLSTESDDVRKVSVANHDQAAKLLFENLVTILNGEEIQVVAHRIVNGGSRFISPTLLNNDTTEVINELGKFSPLHTKSELSLVDAMSKLVPKASQVACFDSAFHATMPKTAKLLPIPREYYDKGLRRYGFHGLAYQHVVKEVKRNHKGDLPSKIVAAHLGSGASLTAILDGRSIDTTMAFSPNSGIPMSTRSGDLDPEVIFYLLQSEGLSIEQAHQLLNEKSGLLGMSELSPEMKVLLEREDEDQKAKEVADVFCYQVKKTIAAYTAALGGLDCLTFSGGMGENAPKIRSRICEGLKYFGVDIDNEANLAGAEVISTDSSRVKVMIVRVDESESMADQVQEFLELDGGKNETEN